MLSLLAEQSQSALARVGVTGEIIAYGMIRPGKRAAYLGPVVALPNHGSNRVVGLVEHLLETDPNRPVYWDIPDHQTSAVSLAKHLGFKRQRSFTRMVLGENCSPGNPQYQWAIGGPAIG